MAMILRSLQKILNGRNDPAINLEGSIRSAAKTLAVPALVLALFLGIGTTAFAKSPDPPILAPVRMIVTAAALHGQNPPPIAEKDVQVFQEREKREVTAWTPAQGDHAGLDLYLLVDDSASSDVDGMIGDLRDFINAQPDTTSISVGYLSHGVVEWVQTLTNNHMQAAKSIRIPIGFRTVFDSPFLSLASAVKNLPNDSNRHEFLVVSSGIDLFRGIERGALSPDADTAIERAQRAGAIVNTIYITGSGRLGKNVWVATDGQTNLAKVAAETGGIALTPFGIGEPARLKPFLDQVQDSLANQYLLEFQAGKKAGLQPVSVETEVPNAELIAAANVYAPVPK